MTTWPWSRAEEPVRCLLSSKVVWFANEDIEMDSALPLRDLIGDSMKPQPGQGLARSRVNPRREVRQGVGQFSRCQRLRA